MKLRGSLIALLISALVAVPLRVIASGGNSTPLIEIGLPVVIALASLLLLVMSLSCNEYPRYSSEETPTTSMGIFALLTAAAYGYSAAQGLFGEGSVFEGMPGTIYTALEVVSALAFILMGIAYLRGEVMAENSPIVPLLPAICLIMRLVLSFFEYTKRANITDDIYEVFAVAFMLMFMIFSGKFMSGCAGNSAKWVCGAGSVAILFTVLRLVPCAMQIISILTGKSSLAIMDALDAHTLIDLASAFYALGTIAFTVSDDTVGAQEVAQEAPRKSKKVSRVPALIGVGSSKRPASSQDDKFIPEIATVETITSSSYSGKTGAPAVSSQSRTSYAAPVPPKKATQTTSSRQGYAAPVPPRRVPLGLQLQADEYTERGAGMQVSEEFRIRPTRGTGDALIRYEGLDAFRTDMRGGKKAMDVLESSLLDDGLKSVNPFGEDGADVPAPEDTAETSRRQSKETEEMLRDVDRSLEDTERKYGRRATDHVDGEVKYGRRATDRVDSEVKYGRRATDRVENVNASPDEDAPDMSQQQEVQPPMPDTRTIHLGSNSANAFQQGADPAAMSAMYGANPYAQQNPYSQQANPYGNPYAQANPYATPYGANPYAQQNPYGQNPYGQNDPYGTQYGQAPQYGQFGQQYADAYSSQPYGEPYGAPAYGDDYSQGYGEDYTPDGYGDDSGYDYDYSYSDDAGFGYEDGYGDSGYAGDGYGDGYGGGYAEDGYDEYGEYDEYSDYGEDDYDADYADDYGYDDGGYGYDDGYDDGYGGY